MQAQAGLARTSITPTSPVELTGWGYFLERYWREVRDPLHATVLVVQNEATSIAVISLDLMLLSEEFTQQVREGIAEETDLSVDHILVCATHTHNAPASGGLLGVGEVDPDYEDWVIEQTIKTGRDAWQSREAANLFVSTIQEHELSFNRTRPQGTIDPTLTTLQIRRPDESMMGMVVGFQAHPTVWTKLKPWSISRDVPGEICDRLEAVFPGSIVMYLQGACGDVNFHREYSTSEEAARIPATRLSSSIIDSLSESTPLVASDVGAACQRVQLPTRRWTREELDHDRVEAERRLSEQDLTGWEESIGRVMTTQPREMVARHGGDEWKAVAAMCRFNLEWTEKMLSDYETRAEVLETEIQALRIDQFGIVSNSTEFFSSLALEVRERVNLPHLMFACYANGRIGYLPDAHDVEHRTYAAYQSPKYCDQFPFTAQSGPVMVQAMSELFNQLETTSH